MIDCHTIQAVDSNTLAWPELEPYAWHGSDTYTVETAGEPDLIRPAELIENFVLLKVLLWRRELEDTGLEAADDRG